MASCQSDLNLQRPQSDTYPLLMDHSNAALSHECAVNILPESPEGLQECTGPGMPARCGNAITAEASNTSLASSSSHTYVNPPEEQLGRTETNRNQDHATYDSGQQRRRHLGSRLWTAIEMMLTISQIIASTIVLSISRHEKPKAPLFLWILGYTAGCLASLPVLYWRYASRNVNHSEHEQRLASSEVSIASSPTSPGPSHTLSQSNLLHNDDLESGGHGDQAPHSEESRIGAHIDRMKVGLECFFAVWFVVGNVWIFGGHSSYHDAPNLYRLCIVFLTFSCIGYAMPFVICATICCCLPCIITLLGYREDHGQVKGATSEIIEALPIYKFKIKGSSLNACKDLSDSESEDPGQEGIFAAGTERERFISSEDAVCCICLGKYRDGVDLKELPCAHFFHVECVDKWLKINGSCPLCKHELKGFDDQSELPTTTEAGT